jgi:hypothetical protein
VAPLARRASAESAVAARPRWRRRLRIGLGVCGLLSADLERLALAAQWVPERTAPQAPARQGVSSHHRNSAQLLYAASQPTYVCLYE